MTKLERAIDIDAPPEAVYDVLADPSCLGEWVTIQEELEEAPDGDLETGSRLRQRMKVAGKLAARGILKASGREADRTLERLKELVERRRASG